MPASPPSSAPRGVPPPPRGRAFARVAANDDQADADARALHRAALRVFERHGASAATHAQDQAARAFFAGDRAASRWWLALGRALDGALAAETAAGRQFGGSAA
ncbi:MAG: hypothetical protein ABW194_03780 [Novosphingobium sp.]